ncbi:uncharacterized protein VTP21DRAFT_453 [Calcarisporiella thermophila]|uniref:uncharacterized protein n=1 Tax=Calcarisporiella thermophila TaxID=911321 RepID=UPI003742414B
MDTSRVTNFSHTSLHRETLQRFGLLSGLEMMQQRMLPLLRRVAPFISGHGTRAISTIPTQNVITAMTERGLIQAITSPHLTERTQSPTTVYCGVDPTAPSLHIGNLVTLLGLLHFHVRGHQVIALLGGATGTIGDPSGRRTERVPLSPETLQHNIARIEAQLHRFFKNGEEYFRARGGNPGVIRQPWILNNAEWYRSMGVLDFLGDIGRFMRVGNMLAKESVKSRMESTQGISFTEFSYQLLQAYDFWHLYHEKGCQVQLGGSDQWGNITAGIDLISKKKPADALSLSPEAPDEESEAAAFGFTIPLLTTSTGEKFGKSAGNAIWVDEKMTSYYDFYQFFMRAADADVEKYIRYFTFLPMETVAEVMQEHRASPEHRIAQRLLADEACELVHGKEGVAKARLATEVLFGSSLEKVRGTDLVAAFEHDQRMISLPADQVIGQEVGRVAVLAGACRSRSEAQKLVRANGFYLNNRRVEDPMHRLSSEDLVDGMVCVLRTGKAEYRLVRMTC